MLAPIVLFVYNRVEHTQKTLEALKNNILATESTLYIYSDGSKADATTQQISEVEKVREFIASEKWCKEVYIKLSETNIGLAKSIVNGVTEIINKYNKIIVLEDDIITSPNFLKYMNDALTLYETTQNVYSINAYMYPVNEKKTDTFLSPLAINTWGWGTWKDKWAVYNDNLSDKELIQKNVELKTRFNFGGFDYASLLSYNNSWGIKWYYSVFMCNGLGLFPTRSLVANIGFDGSGTHQNVYYKKDIIYNEPITLIKHDTINSKYNLSLLKYVNSISTPPKRSVIIPLKIKLYHTYIFIKKVLNLTNHK